jgi:hypothetical protein
MENGKPTSTHMSAVDKLSDGTVGQILSSVVVWLGSYGILGSYV